MFSALMAQALFAAGNTLEANLSAAGAVRIFCKAEGDTDGVVYTGRCTANIPPGKYTIEPFGLGFEVGPTIETQSSSPWPPPVRASPFAPRQSPFAQ